MPLRFAALLDILPTREITNFTHLDDYAGLLACERFFIWEFGRERFASLAYLGGERFALLAYFYFLLFFLVLWCLAM